MRRIVLAAALAVLACSSKSTDPTPDSGTPDSGCPGCSAWTTYTIDSTQSSNQVSSIPQLALAIRSDDTVGMLWFEPVGVDDLGVTNYELRYRAWNGGNLGAVEPIRQMERLFGVSLAYNPLDGEPIAGYLGGPVPLPPSSGGPAYWFQNDAVVSYRNQGTWTEESVATMSAPPTGPANGDNLGDVVGLFPAVGVASDGTAFLVYRDVHYGQSPSGDFDGSDWEMGFGGPTSWTPEEIKPGFNGKGAWGGHSQVVMVNDEPALVGDQMTASAGELGGSNVWFTKRTGAGAWAGPTSAILTISNLQSGPSLAYDPILGFGVAAIDANNSALYFTSSPDGTSQWTTPDPVAQEGSGGWYPSLAISPQTHDPSIAYYFCSPNPGVAEGACSSNSDELRLAERVSGNWRISTVDTAGGFQPKLGFLSNGKRVILLRDPKTGVVKLEVEN